MLLPFCQWGLRVWLTNFGNWSETILAIEISKRKISTFCKFSCLGILVQRLIETLDTTYRYIIWWLLYERVEWHSNMYSNGEHTYTIKTKHWCETAQKLINFHLKQKPEWSLQFSCGNYILVVIVAHIRQGHNSDEHHRIDAIRLQKSDGTILMNLYFGGSFPYLIVLSCTYFRNWCECEHYLCTMGFKCLATKPTVRGIFLDYTVQ
jgi:hypothetical protein